MSRPIVTAVTLNYRNAWQAVRCARAFLAQTLGDRLEVIVIDNHSDDDSIGIIRNNLKDTRVRIVETPKNGGFGYGYNSGVSYAEGEYVLINNPDKILQPDGVELLMKQMEADPTIGILAPRLLHDDGTQRQSIRARPRPADLIIKRTFLRTLFPHRVAHYLQEFLDPTLPHDVDWVAGGCFMIRRSVFKELGGFDPRFFLFFEDTDLCRRCWQKGLRVVYTPAVTATDKKTRLSEMSVRKMLFSPVGRAHIMSAIRYFMKWGINENKETRSQNPVQ